jgi:dolichol-phosphate mannosyltransferase
VDGILAAAPHARLLIVDDNSPDGTGAWADQKAEQDSRLSVLHRTGKLGLGSAILQAMKISIDENYDFLLNMDADLSHDPAAIPRLVSGMDACDVMIGSRYIAGGGTQGWPWYRRGMSRGVNWLARRLLRLPTRDCSSGYRCFRTSRLAQLDFEHIRSTGYSFHEELLWHLKRAGARLGETPILFVDRRFGRSKIDMWEALVALWVMFRLGLRDRFSR